MEIYLHRTDGGAEYYVTNPEGRMCYPDCPAVLRTDGDELEVLSMEAIKRAGFKSVKLNIITEDERIEILNALSEKKQSYQEASGNEFAQQRMAEIARLIEKMKAIL